jgi:hypothetical protein
MMFNNNRVRRALQLAFMTGAAATFAFTAPIHAQEQDADEEEEFLEEVVVTGSRISGRTDISSATPVSVAGLPGKQRQPGLRYNLDARPRQ